MRKRDVLACARAAAAAAALGVGVYRKMKMRGPAGGRPVPLVTLRAGDQFSRRDPDGKLTNELFIRTDNEVVSGKVRVTRLVQGPHPGVPRSLDHMELEPWLLVVPAQKELRLWS